MHAQVQVRLTVCELDGMQHILSFDNNLITDTSLLATVLAVTCKRNWVYAAHPASSHTTYQLLKTPVKTPLLVTYEKNTWQHRQQIHP